MLNALAQKRVLVTGAEGFIGRQVVALAKKHGGIVIGLGKGDCDLRDGARTLAIFAEHRPEYVVHTAGLVDWRQDASLVSAMIDVHVRGTAHVLDASKKHGARRVVCFGSAGEYGAAAEKGAVAENARAEPLDPYSASKLAATELALMFHRSFGLETTIVRPFNVYGPGESAKRLFPSLFALARQGGGQFPCTAGEQLRDFVYVEDVAEGALRAALAPEAAGRCLNLARGSGTTVRDALILAAKISNGVVQPQFGTMPYRPGEPMQLLANIALTSSYLQWSPTVSLQQGLEKMWRT